MIPLDLNFINIILFAFLNANNILLANKRNKIGAQQLSFQTTDI